jgi:hypothetical protein
MGFGNYGISIPELPLLVDVDQPSHGFTLPSFGFLPLYYNNLNSQFELANANSIGTAADCVAVGFPDANTITIQLDGQIEVPLHGLDVGKWYVLRSGFAGLVLPLDSHTSENVQYLAFVIDENNILIRVHPIFIKSPGLPISIIEDWTSNTSNSVPLTAGQNRMLVLNTSWEDNVSNSATAVSVGGVSGTLVEEQTITSGFSQGSHQFRWDESQIASMSGTAIAVTWQSGAPNTFGVSTALLENVNQSIPLVGTNTDSGTGATDTLDADVNTEEDGYSVLVCSGGNEGMGFTNNGTGWTRKLNLVLTSADSVVDDKLITADASPENVNMGITGSNRHVLVVSSYRKA